MYLHSEIPPFFAICNLLASILSFSIIFKREKQYQIISNGRTHAPTIDVILLKQSHHPIPCRTGPFCYFYN